MTSEAATKPAIGIDLGTTNSSISVWRDGKAELIPNVLGDMLTPSVVSLDEDGSILIGRPALSRLTTHPLQTAALFKRFMGSSKQYNLNGQTFTPAELSALVLKSLKADAEAYLEQPIDDVIISVPAYFSDEQRKQTRFAAELAGLKVSRLINEPTAAAMAYGLHTQEFGRTLVFDLGGGTFDVTVLEYALPLIEVHASAGDNYLGGEDFTQALVKDCLEHWSLSESELSLDALAQLNDIVEQVKCNKKNEDKTIVWQYQDNTLTRELDDKLLEKIWQPLLNRLRAPIEQALADARIKSSQLDNIVLVGGASNLSIIQRMVVKLFGMMPHQHLDPSTIVALGAAVQAACRLRDQTIDEVILTDVCPYSLGVASSNDRMDGIFSPIIERNTVVPTSRVERFFTSQAQQKYIHVAVYQGENPRVSNNILVDKFDVPIEPSDEIQAIDIRFSYDINGLLEVDITLPDSQVSHHQIIDHSPVGLSEQQRQQSHQRLNRLKIHPRDTLVNRALIARLERAWSQTLGMKRQQITLWLEEFEMVLKQQNQDEIKEVNQLINEYLDSMNL